MYRCETATNWEDVKHFYEIAEKQRLEIAELLRSRGEKVNINQI